VRGMTNAQSSIVIKVNSESSLMSETVAGRSVQCPLAMSNEFYVSMMTNFLD